jgi:hypothetical protein
MTPTPTETAYFFTPDFLNLVIVLEVVIVIALIIRIFSGIKKNKDGGDKNSALYDAKDQKFKPKSTTIFDRSLEQDEENASPFGKLKPTSCKSEGEKIGSKISKWLKEN